MDAISSIVAEVVGVRLGDLPGLATSSGAAFSLMGGYYFIQPMSDAMSLRAGIGAAPIVTVASVLMLTACNPLYAYLVESMDGRLDGVQPFLHRLLSLCLVFFAVLFVVATQGSLILSFSFAIFLSVLAPFLMSMFWVRMAHVHTLTEAQRVYGVIAAAAQCGQLIASVAAGPTFHAIGENVLVVTAIAVECSVRLIEWRAGTNEVRDRDTTTSPPDDHPGSAQASTTAASQTSRSVFGGVALLFSTPLLRAVTAHTLLLSFLVSCIWYERAELATSVFASSEERVGFFASLNAVVGGVTLLLQLVVFSRVMSSSAVGPTGTLLAEPLVLVSGLLVALWWPSSLVSIAYLDCSRKISHYALAKPTKESIYAMMPSEVQYRAKPLLDTLVNRAAALLGAGFFALCMRLSIAVAARRGVLLAVVLVWAAVARHLGRLSSSSPRTPPALADDAATADEASKPRGDQVWQHPTPTSKPTPTPTPHRESGGGDRPTGVTSTLAWLFVFCASGIGLGMVFEVLQLHAGPARAESFFLAFLGYWSQVATACIVTASTGSWRRCGGRDTWNRRAILALLASSVLSGLAHCFDYLALVEGGYSLFTILHSSVTFFACVIAAALGARVTTTQFLGAGLVVVGLLATSFPHPLSARGSYTMGAVAAVAGSLSLAASYPLTETVFRVVDRPPAHGRGGTPLRFDRHGRHTEDVAEVAVLYGSIFNSVNFGLWTLLYTLPRWDSLIVQPIHASNVAQPSVRWAVVGYSLHVLLVGVHALAFFKSVSKVGAVPVAVSKGAQQAGSVALAHVLFCGVDEHECMWPDTSETSLGLLAWSRWQKPAAFIVCCLGVVVYVLGTEPARPPSATANAAAPRHPFRGAGGENRYVLQ